MKVCVYGGGILYEMALLQQMAFFISVCVCVGNRQAYILPNNGAPPPALLEDQGLYSP